MSVHRLPDGSTVFLCGRGQVQAHAQREALLRQVADKAAEEGRCRLCLSPLEENCGIDRGQCQRPVASIAQCLAFLHGMILG